MGENKYPFEFSVILSVYNVEKYIHEAVDSLIAQDFGFEKIQLVFVDDGSTDNSGAICDEYAKKYPDNVVVTHKENGGLSSARNAGVRLATGRFLNFFDPDDRMDSQVFSAVHKFFVAHEEEVDIVSIPMMLFGAQQGPHVLNNKFENEDRVIDLNTQWWNIQMSLATAFVKADTAKAAYCFKEDLLMATAEDAKEIIKILLRNPKLGTVNNGYYRYRKREGSRLYNSQNNALWYTAYLDSFSKWALDYSIALLGYMPKFIQYMVVYDLQWKLRQQSIPAGVLSEEENERYKATIIQILSFIDDDVIMAQRNIFPEHKAWIFEQKYNKSLHLLQWKDDVILATDCAAQFSLSQSKTIFEFFKIENEKCYLEGYTVIYPTHIKNAQIEVEINGKRYPCEQVDRGQGIKIIGEPISYHLGFRCCFPLRREDEKYNIKLIVKLDGFWYQSRNFNGGKFFPVGRKYESAYFIQNKWRVSLRKNSLNIHSCGRKGQIKSEISFLKELWKRNEQGGRKAVLARIGYHLLKRLHRKPIWLVSDRINKADDNGEAFFRYIQKEHRKEIKSYFVLSKDSSDYERLQKIGPVVDNLSWKHKMLFLLCDYNISAQADAITSNPFPGYEDGFREMLCRERFVFLQHGVIKDDLSDWLNRYKKNLYGFVTAANPEYQSILDGAYFYTEKQVWLTGLPRFDRRYHDEKEYITIMPTWRMYLLEAANMETGLRKTKPGFRKSKFFQFYQGLLNNPRLLRAAKEAGYQLRIFMHPNMQPHLSEFNISPDVKILGLDTSYNEVYAHSNLVVTDYSSAVFDFAYLRKPIVYCHFDADEFFAGEHVYTRGYFDYERDGFGEVEYDLESTVSRLIEYMENGCKLKDKYRERIDNFFAFDDQNNCQRVYDKIMELEKQDEL